MRSQYRSLMLILPLTPALPTSCSTKRPKRKKKTHQARKPEGLGNADRKTATGKLAGWAEWVPVTFFAFSFLDRCSLSATDRNNRKSLTSWNTCRWNAAHPESNQNQERWFTCFEIPCWRWSLDMHGHTSVPARSRNIYQRNTSEVNAMEADGDPKGAK